MVMRLAAVDLGSNSFRLEIGSVEGNEIICEHYCKEGVRLAAGLDESGNLTEQAQLKALDTLSRFHEQIKDFPQNCVRAVGTQTIRIARNNTEFINRAQKVLGFPIEILPGHFLSVRVFCLYIVEEIRLVLLICFIPFSE